MQCRVLPNYFSLLDYIINFSMFWVFFLVLIVCLLHYIAKIKTMSVCVMVFNATFNNISVISWRSVLLVKESGGPGENH